MNVEGLITLDPVQPDMANLQVCKELGRTQVELILALVDMFCLGVKDIFWYQISNMSYGNHGMEGTTVRRQ